MLDNGKIGNEYSFKVQQIGCSRFATVPQAVLKPENPASCFNEEFAQEPAKRAKQQQYKKKERKKRKQPTTNLPFHSCITVCPPRAIGVHMWLIKADRIQQQNKVLTPEHEARNLFE